jgi:type IX secretion system PorP/SprF family membrane protein
MRKIIIIYLLLMPVFAFGQQFPYMDAYYVNPYSLSPAYAGLHNKGTIFMDYRSDWTGIDGGPRTYQLSYSDRLKDRVGLGGKFVYDKTDIFQQMFFMGTYTYEVKIQNAHSLNFGLSMGFYRNAIDLSKYYNNPTYVQDLVLLYGQQESKLKFVSDFSVLYRYKRIEAGILFSNLMYGSVHYQKSEMTYKPFMNYLLHASYLARLDDNWTVKPTVVWRGGQHVPTLVDVSAALTWTERFYATALFRTSGVFGVGLGGEICKGILLNYSYNMSKNLPMDTFGSHQVTLGVEIFRIGKEKNPKHP